MGALETEFMAAAEALNFDFSVQEDTVFRRNRRLVAFDMDSTLIRQEVIDELALRHGVGDGADGFGEDDDALLRTLPDQHRRYKHHDG